MGFGRNMAVAESFRREDWAADSGRYFEQLQTSPQFQARERVWPPRWKQVLGDHFLGSLINNRLWNLQDTSAAGAPTSLILDRAGGWVSLKLASTSEAEVYGINCGDFLQFNPTGCGLVLEAGIAIPTAITTAQRFVVGFCSAHNDTFDSMAQNAWFKCDTSMALVVESDDAVTDNDDVSTGTTMTAAFPLHLRIEAVSNADVRFYINGARVASSTTLP